ncbi:MAG: hypothetical protein JWN85_4377 [Gammaproteobacteria bacterium]|nr:hypothetical protein [Gammaproteobacteria bacterium]
MSYQPHPHFQQLFAAYTADAASLGMQLARLMDRRAAGDPLLVCTGSDMVLFAGSGSAPVMESFRRTTRGFIELGAISHLPLAVAWLARMREVAGEASLWRAAAAAYIQAIRRTQEINTVALWRDAIQVPAWAGLEPKLVDMVDYSCQATVEVLEQALRDESGFTFERLRREYLDPVSSERVPVPMNDMMVATFALTFLDIGHRIMGWLGSQGLSWEHLMVVVSGRSGRPTAGLTWASNNMCHLIERASQGRFSKERLYIAPHAPSLDLAAAADPARWPGLEAQFRTLWFNTRTTTDMAACLFEGYPRFVPAAAVPLYVSPQMSEVDRLPKVRTVEDRFALIARMRFVLEDPLQLASNSVADYVIDQLAEHGNDPSKVFIAGFTDIDYAAVRRARRG